MNASGSSFFFYLLDTVRFVTFKRLKCFSVASQSLLELILHTLSLFSRFWADQQLLKVPHYSHIFFVPPELCCSSLPMMENPKRLSGSPGKKACLALWLQPSAKKKKKRWRASCSIFHVIRSLITLLRWVSLPLVTSQGVDFFQNCDRCSGTFHFFIELLTRSQDSGCFYFFFFTRALELEHLIFRFRLTAAKSVFWSIQPKIWHRRRSESLQRQRLLCFLSEKPLHVTLDRKPAEISNPLTHHRGCRAL